MHYVLYLEIDCFRKQWRLRPHTMVMLKAKFNTWGPCNGVLKLVER